MLGVLSLIVWALIVTVTLKYVLILLRADNNGEGGTLSLTALASRALGRRTGFVLVVGVIGAAMFLGDSVITPAISVLSAVEGLKLASPAFSDYVVPLAVAILIALFAAQSRGTAKVAAMFGPIMVVWFVAIAIAGAMHIRDDPHVLAAINPLYGVEFLLDHGEIGLVTLGAVFLVVTGGEALYADLGHFGRKPIQTAWLCLVLPALLINYFGQGAKVLADPMAIENPFYRLVPDTFLLPMIVLATAATVIASQAVITGAYSLVHQAIQLGLLAAAHHPAHLGLACRPDLHSARDGSAAGRRAAAGRTVPHLERARFGLRHRGRHHHGGGRAARLCRDMETVEMAAVEDRADAAAVHGRRSHLLFRQFPQTVRGRLGAAAVRRDHGAADPDLAARQRNSDRQDPAHRGADRDAAAQPREKAAAQRAGHGGVSHQRSGFRADRAAAQSQAQQGAARAQRDPHHRHRRHAASCREEDRVQITPLSKHFSRVSLKFGYMEQPNVPKALAIARKHGWQFDIMSTSFFLSRRSLKPSPKSGMPSWQDHLFIALARSASDATDFFQIPTGRVVEVGTQVTV